MANVGPLGYTWEFDDSLYDGLGTSSIGESRDLIELKSVGVKGGYVHNWEWSIDWSRWFG